MQGELIVFVLMIVVIKEASAVFKNEKNPMVFWLWEATKNPSSSSWQPASFFKDTTEPFKGKRNTVYRRIYESSLHL